MYANTSKNIDYHASTHDRSRRAESDNELTRNLRRVPAWHRAVTIISGVGIVILLTVMFANGLACHQ